MRNEVMATLEALEYLKNSPSGNPKIKIKILKDGTICYGRTATNAAVGYYLTPGRTYENAKIQYHITRGGLLIVDSVVMLGGNKNV